MPYREPTFAPPLVVVTPTKIQAFEAGTGAELWCRDVDLGGAGPTRIASTGASLYVARGKKVLCFELATGYLYGEATAWFDVEGMLASGDNVFLIGTGGLACFSQGSYRWGVRHAPGSEIAYRVEDADGNVRELDAFAPHGQSQRDLGLVFGTAVFQPDYDT